MLDSMECQECNAYVYADAQNRNSRHDRWHDYMESRFADAEREITALQSLIIRNAPEWLKDNK